MTALLVALSALASCQFVYDIIHDDEVVARIGARRLYRSDLDPFIPKNVSGKDSINLAQQYIRTWAADNLIQSMADEMLSKQEKDVREELEDYRSSLLKYRYEQKYINERLDTSVTAAEVEEYYKKHPNLFILSVPVVKARFLDIMKESPDIEKLKELMSSDNPDDIISADSLAYSSALKFIDLSDRWTDMASFARYFDVDCSVLLSALRPDGFVQIEDSRGDLRIGYVSDIVRAGSKGPLEYNDRRIRELIVNNRKHALMSTLERDLLEDALERGELMIY